MSAGGAGSGRQPGDAEGDGTRRSAGPCPGRRGPGVTTTRRLACLLVAALAAVPASAQAAPKSTRYAVASASQHSSCTPGATCTSQSYADRTGAVSASSRYARPAAGDGRPHEAAHGWATHGTSLSVPAGSRSVTITATWQLDVRDVTATAQSGTAYGLVSLDLRVPQCPEAAEEATCVTSRPTVASARRVYHFPWQRAAGLPPFSEGRDGVQTVTTSVTVTPTEGGAVPRDLAVYPEVGATAGGYPDCVLRPAVGCAPALREQHAGTSSATFSGALTSVVMEAV